MPKPSTKLICHRLPILGILLLAVVVKAQPLGNLNSRYIKTHRDTVQLDSLSLVPGSVFLLTPQGNSVDTAAYKVNYVKSLLIWKKKPQTDSVRTMYRVFPVAFDKTYRHKDARKLIFGSVQKYYNPFRVEGENRNAELFKFNGLNKSGSISRGVSFGNNQDVIVNSSLNLQLNGKLTDDIDILAAITDENIPFQPDGNTQQLQEFDKVFIQFSRKNDRLIIGDFQLQRPNSYFMNMNKKAQGISLLSTFSLGKKKDSPRNTVSLSAALSKGKFARQTFTDNQEGNQGPYRLKGANGEQYIIILSGTEKVYLDGRLLARGQQNDYIIDYNTSEVTFTSKHLITKDSRIAIEFQYSDKNYSRSLIHFSDELETKRFKLRFNAFSEQDSKNQPVLQTLTDSQKVQLKNSGNDLSKAISRNIDSVAFAPDQVLYRRVDTTLNGVPYRYYAYSIDPNLAHWRLGFSEVGPGKGDYIAVNSSANGRVYKWVPPANGVSQGNFAPITLLIAPKQQQLYTLGGDYKIDKNTNVTTELGLSNYNQNLFSDKDKESDIGYAIHSEVKNNAVLSKDSVWKLQSALSLEGVNKNFTPLERYRSVEFERDWNLTNATLLGNEALLGANFNLLSKQVGSFNYQLKTYSKGSDYKGTMNLFNTNNTWQRFRLKTNNSLLNANSLNTVSQYIRHNADFSRSISHNIIVGLKEAQEINRFHKSNSDSLQTNSFRYYEYGAYISSADSNKYRYRGEYTERYDLVPKDFDFKKATKAKNLNFTTALTPNNNQHFASTTTYRVLDILDTTATTHKSENSLVNRIEYNATLAKGLINTSTFYEVGAGQELKKDYTFLQVARGKGNYIWNDFNHNGIHEKNEYVLAVYPDTAQYVKVYTPTADYIKSRSNEFNEVFFLNPAAVSKKHSLAGKVLARISNQFTLQLSKKTVKDPGKSELSYLNPFFKNVDDSTLITTQSVYRNTLSINRNKSKFGFDLNWESRQNKALLTNGFETRTINEQGIIARSDLSRTFNLNLTYKTGLKVNESQFFSTNDYRISYIETQPKLNFQPGALLRISIYYDFSKKNNASQLQERYTANKYGTEVRVNSVKIGAITGKASVVKVAYNVDDTTPIAYEMLEGLRTGENLTWGLSIQRTLSNNTQLSFNYDGRKSPGVNAVHTGGVQLRAFF